MAVVFRGFLILLGMIIALFGIGADYILPGANPGLNLPQLLIIALGFALAVAAHRFDRAGGGRFRAGRWKSALALWLMLVFTLLILELLLAIFGFSAYFGSREPKYYNTTQNNFYCDEAGCRYDYDLVTEACAKGKWKDRPCIVNRQGFPDHKDFEIPDDFADRNRILMLGDSFTHGFSADVGSSFVEAVDARFPGFMVWNAAFKSTATNQALATFEALAPLLQPHLTVLGFVMNDFEGNLTPIDSWFVTEDADGNMAFVRPYRIDQWGNVIRLDEAAVHYFATFGIHLPPNEIERLLGSSRLGTLGLRLRDNIIRLNIEDRLFAKGHTATREYLRQLRAAATAQPSQVLALLIPSADDVKVASERFLAAVALMEELELPYMNLRGNLTEADYAPPPDGHWNTAGHLKVGQLLGDCVQVFFDSGALGGCDSVVLPE